MWLKRVLVLAKEVRSVGFRLINIKRTYVGADRCRREAP